jgi:hypothetical protein
MMPQSCVNMSRPASVRRATHVVVNGLQKTLLTLDIFSNVNI